MGSNISAMSSEITDLLQYFKKLEADLAVLKNMSEKLLQRITDNERQRWTNVQYSPRGCLQVTLLS